jgi:hypothetical protein
MVLEKMKMKHLLPQQFYFVRMQQHYSKEQKVEFQKQTIVPVFLFLSQFS